MKLFTLGFALILTVSTTFSQHNYLITSPDAESTYIRDAVVLDDESLLCALDLANGDKTETAITQVSPDGSIDWAKKIKIGNTEDVYGFDVLAHENGSYYLHGLAMIDFKQYAFVLKISAEGILENHTFFALGDDYYCGINKMKTMDNGDLIFSFTHNDKVSFVRLNPKGELVWGNTIGRTIFVAGKKPGYDFQIMEDGNIIACGKNNYHFGILKLSSAGQLIWDQDILLGDYSQAKTIQVLPDGNLFLTGDSYYENDFTSFIMKVDGVEGIPLWAKKIDQFDGSFHYQQTELRDDEIHLTMMGNNNPSKMNPDFQNYYVRLDFEGEVLGAFRNGDRYDLADYQRLIRTKNSSIIYGSAYNDSRKIGGLVHSYKSHAFDMCYWTELDVSTSAVTAPTDRSFGAYPTEESIKTIAMEVELLDLKLNAEGTCAQVWNESTYYEEENATAGEIAQIKALVESNEFVVYPNPHDGLFTIRTTYFDVNVTVLDLAGKIIYHGHLENNDVVDLTGNPNGIYIMQIVTETESLIRRIQIR